MSKSQFISGRTLSVLALFAAVAIAGDGVQAQTAGSTQTASAKPAARRVAPILLRRPMPPARVEWQAALKQAQAMRTQKLSGAFAAHLQKPELDRTLLPVILPRAGTAISAVKARLMSFGDAYALSLPQDKGVQITLYGNRSFVPADAGAISRLPMRKLAGMAEQVDISQTEDGWTATFQRFGVVYTMDVSCDDSASPACQSDAYIRQTVASLDDVTMGSQASAEASQSQSQSPANLLDQVGQTFNRLGNKLVKGN